MRSSKHLMRNIGDGVKNATIAVLGICSAPVLMVGLAANSVRSRIRNVKRQRQRKRIEKGDEVAHLSR